jgi:ferredoxin-NADP reductase
MIDIILKANPKADVKLFFGVYALEYDFTKRFFDDYLDPNKYPNFKIITCADNLKEDEHQIDFQTHQTSQYLGKVTEILVKLVLDFHAPDFYICGNPYMVTDMEKNLLEKGALENIYTEKYGTLTK